MLKRIIKRFKKCRKGIGFIEYMIGTAVVVILALSVYGLVGGGARTSGNKVSTDIGGFKATLNGTGASGNFTAGSGSATANGITIQ